MRKLVLICLTILIVSVSQANAQSTSSQANAQSTSDGELIKQAALDYIEGWYEGNAERMERALHPELAKRIVRTDAKGRSGLGQMGAMTLVQSTRAGGGKDTAKEKQQKDVTVLDIFGNSASAKVIASGWVDYLHLAKWNGRWVIVNVLWELKPSQ
jgi:Putative lumazine-binding